MAGWKMEISELCRNLNADKSGNYVDKVAGMTASIIALSFYYSLPCKSHQ